MVEAWCTVTEPDSGHSHRVCLQPSPTRVLDYLAGQGFGLTGSISDYLAGFGLTGRFRIIWQDFGLFGRQGFGLTGRVSGYLTQICQRR